MAQWYVLSIFYFISDYCNALSNLDGSHFVTATTAPRMQVGNEFRIWDFKGKEVHRWKAEKHLFGILPLTSDPPLPFPENELDAFMKTLGNKPPVASKIDIFSIIVQ
jgi:hypothetical protein